ncbi:hypothetical protein [Streptomyces sp. 1222.5]|uniref:hypothetical protein n=1 Tax=Streptomyces sp. 1222.5 TaxID=1881026 RepID=UPI00352436D3
MARRLPSLVLRSLKTAWQVDRVAAVGLLACQVGTGVLAALGLLAVTGSSGRRGLSQTPHRG